MEYEFIHDGFWKEGHILDNLGFLHLYCAVTPCYCSMRGALGRVVSFEACSQCALLSVQITRHYPISIYYAEVFILLSV